MTLADSTMPRLLKIVDYHHPLLRQVMPPVDFPLTSEDKHIILDMKYSIQREQLQKAEAPWDTAVGMAANQWGIPKRIFLFCPSSDTSHALEVIINPSYLPLHHVENPPAIDEEWEACFSVPLATGNVQRYTHILATYQDEQGQTLTRELSGWPARVWQHENDHLNGILYEDEQAGKCIQKESFSSKEEVLNFRSKKREPASQ